MWAEILPYRGIFRVGEKLENKQHLSEQCREYGPDRCGTGIGGYIVKWQKEEDSREVCRAT